MSQPSLAFVVVLVALVVFAAVVVLGVGHLASTIHLPGGIVR